MVDCAVQFTYHYYLFGLDKMEKQKLIAATYTGMPLYYDGHKFYTWGLVANDKFLINYGQQGCECVIRFKFEGDLSTNLPSKLFFGLRNADKSDPSKFRFQDGAGVEITLPQKDIDISLKMTYLKHIQRLIGNVNDEVFNIPVHGEEGVKLINLLYIKHPQDFEPIIQIDTWNYQIT